MERPADFRFDGWTLHRGSGELVKGAVRVRLQCQPLAILEELLARPGEVVTREQLVARLWPRGVVDFDTALNSAVRRLRTALEDHASEPRYIETIPKRGYRFVGTLDLPVVVPPRADLPAPAGVAPRPGRPHWAIAAALVLVTATLLVVSAGKPPAVRTVVPEAQQRYLVARHLLQRRGPGEVARSLGYFRGAIDREPTFAAAWAGLASAWWIETMEGRLDPSVGLPRVREAAERALRLDDGLAEAHLRLSNYWSRMGRRDLAEASLRRGLAADPDHPLALAFRAGRAIGDGRLAEGIELQRRALADEPLSVPTRVNLAVWLELDGRAEATLEALRELRQLHPGLVNPSGLASRALVLQRRFHAALELARETTDEDDRLQSLALAYAGLGQSAESDAILRAMLESGGAYDPVRLAEVYAYRGETDLAFEWLARAISDDGNRRCVRNECWPLDMAVHSPFLESLRGDPRWNSWTEAVRVHLSVARAAPRPG